MVALKLPQYFATGIFALLAAASVLSGPVSAQQWRPERHVELIVPADAGGSLDQTGRTLHRLWEDLKLVPGSSAVVNRSGGGHAVAYTFLNQRAGDPHFLSITSSTLHTSHINGRIPLSYRDFTPLAIVLTEYIAFAVRPDSPIRTGRDLVEALAKNPESLSLALSSAVGGTHHISFGLPLQGTKVDSKKLKFVAFNSSGAAVTALLGGHVDVVSSGTGNVAPHVESGKLRVIAVTSPKRLAGPLAAGPTWAEMGLKGTWDNWRGVMGPRGLTPQQIAYWDTVFRGITSSDAFKKLVAQNQWDESYMNAAETRKFMEAEYNELKDVMTFLGLAK